ncbi:hypothetical protein [Tolypothrix bouteillei]
MTDYLAGIEQILGFLRLDGKAGRPGIFLMKVSASIFTLTSQE